MKIEMSDEIKNYFMGAVITVAAILCVFVLFFTLSVADHFVDYYWPLESRNCEVSIKQGEK